MLCDHILGNIDADGGWRTVDTPATIDWLDLTWQQCARRSLRATTRAGVEVKVLLPIGQYPRHGDVLVRSPLIVANLLPAQVLITRPLLPREMGRLALELGNLHAPVAIAGNVLLAIPDGP